MEGQGTLNNDFITDVMSKVRILPKLMKKYLIEDLTFSSLNQFCF